MLLFGSDPEYFIGNKEDYVVPVPFFIYERGIDPVEWDQTTDKNYVHPVILKEDDFKVIMDGVAFELTLPPVGESEYKKFFNNTQKALKSIEDFATRFNLQLICKPTVNYKFYDFFEAGNRLKEHCGIFGCDPDQDAILENYSCPEINVREHKYRYGGGHFHISDKEEVIKKYPKPFIKLLAIFCGNYSISNSSYPDLEKLRAFHYGQPGRFRIQNYPNGMSGVEYRTPSNSWLIKEDIVFGMFEQAKKAYKALNDFRVDIIEKYLDQSISAIQNANQELSKEILEDLEKI